MAIANNLHAHCKHTSCDMCKCNEWCKTQGRPIFLKEVRDNYIKGEDTDEEPHLRVYWDKEKGEYTYKKPRDLEEKSKDKQTKEPCETCIHAHVSTYICDTPEQAEECKEKNHSSYEKFQLKCSKCNNVVTDCDAYDNFCLFRIICVNCDNHPNIERKEEDNEE